MFGPSFPKNFLLLLAGVSDIILTREKFFQHKFQRIPRQDFSSAGFRFSVVVNIIFCFRFYPYTCMQFFFAYKLVFPRYFNYSTPHSLCCSQNCSRSSLREQHNLQNAVLYEENVGSNHAL